MNCHQVLEQLSAFNDKELEADQTNAIKAHLIRCPSCRKKRDLLEEMGRRIRHLPPLTAPEDFQFRVYASIRKYQDRKTQRSSFWRWQAVLVPAAAMVLGVIIGLTTDNVISPRLSEPVMTASDRYTASSIPETVVADDEVIREYTLDRYVQGSMIPVNVATIPDSPEDLYSETHAPNPIPESQSHSSSQYVLDNVPMRVNYERTIY
ncbi:zf-HC2 domain-containing protein [bacterium]|nr:zf-HC2 domain-containing protein [candidate division CSSED10-310 bacterium]